ncbi:NicO-domain-containing protein [Schizophyllum commune H4-8]|uniref:Nickel/cobalt efflux system n=1 Tax=Schizophyllum commune (strain H4-8 / FGSC 9210) TaxID=578458 RepID=D8QCV3_SCHCM|nr:NicO-domain-containing protein [Schizophyllum commune H4-8]KAI5889739.1 NicO-domain-containing protein [Schizophyllum commune H4-8]
MSGFAITLRAMVHKLAFWHRLPRLTLLGRSLLLVVAELLVNAVFWAVAGILFGKNDTRSILGLALLAWTLGLRHALDADHISAIDNATRGLISMGQLPVTCGLFFSLGHSTIVIVVNVAIAISTDVYQHIDGVGSVGGIVGAAVSGSFLFIVGLANSIILYKILQRRREFKRRQREADATGEDTLADFDSDPKHTHMLMMRILGPVLTFVDRPWKMYPVGVLFGFGFDTASSIALLAVSAIGKEGANNETIPTGYIVILPLLFTAGMTFIDSLDSILMLYSYSGFPEHSWKLFETRSEKSSSNKSTPIASVRSCSPLQGSSQPTPYDNNADLGANPVKSSKSSVKLGNDEPDTVDTVSIVGAVAYERKMRAMRVKANMMSGLSIILTLMSILVAFSISLITIMGLIGDNCGPCQEAAEAEDGGGLAGRWWRGWARANDNSGYIGAGIVGAFIVVVASWFGGRKVVRKWRSRRAAASAADAPAERVE